GGTGIGSGTQYDNSSSGNQGLGYGQSQDQSSGIQSGGYGQQQQGKAGMGDKLRGGIEKTAGKVLHQPELIEKGQERQPNLLPPSTMAKLSFLQFVRGQLRSIPPVEKADLTGKTVMVIGANTGIGYEAAKHFVLMKAARVILACRNKEKGDAAIERIKKATGYNTAELKIVDLSSFSSVIAFVDQVEKEGGRLDIVVANAAMASPNYNLTSDGYESTRDGRYPESKLLDILFHRALSSHLGPHSPIIVNGVNPGLCHSELTRDVGGIPAVILWIMRAILARTPEQGARQLVYAALAGKIENGEVEEKFRGAYMSAAKVEEPSDFVIGEEGKVVQEKLWKEVLDILEKVDPKVEGIVREYCVA
ncbi:hypothetical protein H0H93_003571, partial [Arthromyces matolae]